jgi:hypothetical protein
VSGLPLKQGAPASQVPAAPPASAARARAFALDAAPALVAALAGLAWFAAHVGVAIVDPTRTGWLMGGDWGANYLGWAFFRFAPAGLPLGVNPNLPFPVGSSLAYSDSLPIVGVLLRPLAPLLPAEFQYVGPWLALCFALQGFVGAKLVRLWTEDRLTQALGGALFALAPPLLHRVIGPNTGHASLCAHWLVLAFLWLALAPVAPGRARRRIAAAAGLLVVAAGLHPYHVVAGVALTAGLITRLWLAERSLGPVGAAAYLAALLGVAVLGLVAFGYLSPGVVTSVGGFGFFSADGLSLVVPMGWSRLFRGPRLGQGQYEGFGYLGAGVLALGAAGLASLLARRRAAGEARWHALLPALAPAALLALFSLSGTVTVAGERVASIAAYAAVSGITGTFRACGRFIWSLHYLAVVGAIAAVVVAWRDRPRIPALLLGAALAIQIADVSPPWPFRPAGASDAPPSEIWELARGQYKHVALVPPFLFTGGGPAAPEACPMAWPVDAHVPFAHAAYRIGATFNSAYLARIDPPRAAQACRDLDASVVRGALDAETIYVVHPALMGAFVGAGAICGREGNALVCVRDGRAPFGEALRRSR